jgi:hypothetical protein
MEDRFDTLGWGRNDYASPCASRGACSQSVLRRLEMHRNTDWNWPGSYPTYAP